MILRAGNQFVTITDLKGKTWKRPITQFWYCDACGVTFRAGRKKCHGCGSYRIYMEVDE